MAFGMNNAIDAEQQYSQQMQQLFNPYTSSAGNNFNMAQQGIYKGLNWLGTRPNYNQQFADMLQMTPSQLLNQAMSGYKTSPATMEKMRLGTNAANYELASEGMSGSGLNQLADAEIDTMIAGQGMDSYLNGLMKAFGVDTSILDKYDQAGNDIIGAFRDMLNTQFRATEDESDNLMKAGQQESEDYSRQNQEFNQNTRSLGNQLSRMFSRPNFY